MSTVLPTSGECPGERTPPASGPLAALAGPAEPARVASPGCPAPTSRWSEFFRRRLVRQLAGLESGRITLVDGARHEVYGPTAAELRATVTVHHPRFYRRLACGGDLGAAESLLDGDWSSADLTALVRILIRNQQLTEILDRRLAWWRGWRERLGQWLRRNSRHGARRNIRRHYDLGNEFFALFLDETWCYSCGIFESPTATLAEASRAKMERACRALQLGPDDHLLEIGTGWGGLAIHAARHYGCRVTTTTISEQQYQLACQRVRESGLADRIRVLRQDYRELTGCYDKLVCIEMIEAVGHQYFETFFRRVGRLLTPHGRMFLQGIVIADHRFERHTRTADFIGRYVFPGGCLPSVAALLGAMARGSDLRCLWLEDFAPHYAETLRRWRAAFLARCDQVRQLGYDQRLIRLWNYYLCYCEAAFEERRVNLVQMLLVRPAARTTVTPCLARWMSSVPALATATDH